MSDDDHLTHAEWAAALREGRLLGQSCPDCGHVAGTPTAACAHCGSRDLETVELPTSGTVYAETTIAVAPDWFDEAEYQVALVEVGGARVTARIDGDVAIGDAVELAGTLEVVEEPAPVFAPA